MNTGIKILNKILSFHMSVGHCMSSLEKCPFMSSAPFFDQIIFVLLSCKNFLYTRCGTNNAPFYYKIISM